MEIDISEKVSRAIKGAAACVLLLAILCSAGVWWWQKNSTYMILRNASVSGDLVNVGVKASGELLEFLVNDGDTVAQGDRVGRLQIRVSPEQLKQLEAAAERAKGQYQELLASPRESAPANAGGAGIGAARDELERAAKNKERMDGLFAIGGVSKMQQRQAEDAYQAALGVYQAAQSAGASALNGNSGDYTRLLEIAELQMTQAEGTLEAAKKTLQASDIAAPVSGTVHFLGVKAGDSVEAGQVVLKIGDADNLWIEAILEPVQVSKIKLGQFVEYTISNYPGRSFQGTIYEIVENLPEGEGGESALNGIHARISLAAEPGMEIKPGMQTEIKVSL